MSEAKRDGERKKFTDHRQYLVGSDWHMDLHLGFAGYFAQPLALPASRARRVAELLVDPRWPWPPPSSATFIREELSKRTRARKVTGPKGRAHLLAGITDPTNCFLEMYRSSQEVDNHAHVHSITSRRPLPAEAEYPFHMTGQTRGHELPDGASLEAWIELVHELMVAGSCPISGGARRYPRVRYAVFRPRILECEVGRRSLVGLG